MTIYNNINNVSEDYTYVLTSEEIFYDKTESKLEGIYHYNTNTSTWSLIQKTNGNFDTSYDDLKAFVRANNQYAHLIDIDATFSDILADSDESALYVGINAGQFTGFPNFPTVDMSNKEERENQYFVLTITEDSIDCVFIKSFALYSNVRIADDSDFSANALEYLSAKQTINTINDAISKIEILTIIATDNNNKPHKETGDNKYTIPAITSPQTNCMYLVYETINASNDNLDDGLNYHFGLYIYDKDNSTSSNKYYKKLDTLTFDVRDYAKANHVHGNITNDGKLIRSNNTYPSNRPLITDSNGLITDGLWSVSSSDRDATHFVNSADTRLINARTPKPHTDADGVFGRATKDVYGHVKVDEALNESSTNTVQNRVIQWKFNEKQDTLVSGTNIKTINNTSLLGNGDINVQTPITPITDLDNVTTDSTDLATAGSIKSYVNNSVAGISGSIPSTSSIGDVVSQWINSTLNDDNTTKTKAQLNAIFNEKLGAKLSSSDVSATNGSVSQNDTGAYTVGTITVKNNTVTLYGKNTNTTYTAGSGLGLSNNQFSLSSHATSATTYGVGSATNYGHVKAGGSNPAMNGTASAGTDNGLYARADHVHPSDTSKADANGLGFTQTITSSTANKYQIGTIKLNGTDTTVYGKDTVYEHPTTLSAETTNISSNTQTPSFGGTFNIPKLTFNTGGHLTTSATATVTIPNTEATTSNIGLMPTADKEKLDYSKTVCVQEVSVLQTSSQGILLRSSAKLPFVIQNDSIFGIRNTSSLTGDTQRVVLQLIDKNGTSFNISTPIQYNGRDFYSKELGVNKTHLLRYNSSESCFEVISSYEPMFWQTKTTAVTNYTGDDSISTSYIPNITLRYNDMACELTFESCSIKGRERAIGSWGSRIGQLNENTLYPSHDVVTMSTWGVNPIQIRINSSGEIFYRCTSIALAERHEMILNGTLQWLRK